jgi:hypothetical protein
MSDPLRQISQSSHVVSDNADGLIERRFSTIDFASNGTMLAGLAVAAGEQGGQATWRGDGWQMQAALDDRPEMSLHDIAVDRTTASIWIATDRSMYHSPAPRTGFSRVEDPLSGVVHSIALSA